MLSFEVVVLTPQASLESHPKWRIFQFTEMLRWGISMSNSGDDYVSVITSNDIIGFGAMPCVPEGPVGECKSRDG